MKLDELVDKAQETITVRRIFGDPFEKDGVTIIPTARLAGGGGGGGGHDDTSEGEGGGFGVGGQPVGAYVLRDGTVAWQPAVDVNKLIQTVGLVAIVWMFTRARLAKIRSRGGG